jgi:basic membrane lipoprotein Med (substrate-binding protein (PBP1-ABC) superfamily)
MSHKILRWLILLLAATVLVACAGGGQTEELTFEVTWIGFWFNIPGVTLDPTEVTNQFFDNGADVVISGIDTTEGIVVAKQRADQGERVFAIPYDFEGACAEAPEICLGVPYFNWGPAYLDTAESVIDGSWTQRWDWNSPNWDNLADKDTTHVGWISGPAVGGSVPEVSAPAESSLAVEDAEFVFGMILVGPKNDRGWSQAHYEGGLYVEQNLPGSKMIVFESLNSASKPEATLEGVVDDMVAQGARLIFTTSDEFEEDTIGAAEKYPDVVFISVSGDDAWRDGQDAGEAPANVGNIMGRMEDMKAIAGCAAALASETGRIAYLGPLINFETRRLVSSAYLGARYCWENYGDSEDWGASLDEFIGLLASGEVNVWTGPINLQDGTEYIPDGQAATDYQIWYLPQLLEGMIGPSS